MKTAATTYKDGLLEDLRDPVEAAEYLNAALEDDDREVFLLALKDVAEARGLSQLSRDANLNRENLYRLLSEKGNPRLTSLNAILHSLGLKLSVEVSRVS